MKEYTKVFRFDQETADDIETIMGYLEQNNPDMEINPSDAIRYAIGLAAINIRREQKHQAPK